MYSDKQAILQLVALLEQHGIRHIVLCPGSRNAPIVHSLSANGGFTLYGVTDERSAGFYALGLALSLGETVAVCCTSGSALLNLHPAVAEAYYQRVPLLIISADRPEAWIGQMDGQTAPQVGVFGSLCQYATTLPLDESGEGLWLCNRRINEALLALGRSPRPVHINVPLAEPLFGFDTPCLPEVRALRPLPECREALRALAQEAERPLILVGQLRPQAAQHLAGNLRDLVPHGVVLAEHLANLPEGLYNADAIMAVAEQEQLAALHPDLVITLGGHLVSKRIKQWLRQQPPRWHWHLSAEAEVVDLFAGALTHVGYSAPWFATMQATPSRPAQKTAYQAAWHRLSARLTPPEGLPYCATSAAGELIGRLPAGCTLHLGNSMSVRLAQLYPLPEGVSVQCNRGINGIEGSLSAALGYARADGGLNFVLLGDLSFFYDMNALCLPLPPTVRIVVLNNHGGGIFSALPQMPREASSYAFITGVQQRSARRWAEDSGLSYHAVNDLGSLSHALEELCQGERTEGVLVEVFTDTDTDNAALRAYYSALSDTIKTD